MCCVSPFLIFIPHTDLRAINLGKRFGQYSIDIEQSTRGQIHLHFVMCFVHFANGQRRNDKGIWFFNWDDSCVKFHPTAMNFGVQRKQETSEFRTKV